MNSFFSLSLSVKETVQGFVALNKFRFGPCFRIHFGHILSYYYYREPNPSFSQMILNPFLFTVSSPEIWLGMTTNKCFKFGTISPLVLMPLFLETSISNTKMFTEFQLYGGKKKPYNLFLSTFKQTNI